MQTLDDILLESTDKMEKTCTHVQEQLAGVRTGKASPSLVENVLVDYYGAPTRLREIAAISTPEHSLIVINSYDPSALGEIARAIMAANLGVTPVSDGRVVRVPIPALSGERRKELVKLARRIAEEGRVAVRNVRRESNEQVKALHKDGKATEDERDAALAQIQKETDAAIAHIDTSVSDREKQVMDG